MKVENIEKNIFRVPENPNCHVDSRGLGIIFMERMNKFKNNVAQVDGETGHTLTHGEVSLRSIRVAQHLQEQGVKYGDVIVICATNSMNTSLPLIAGIFLGATVAPLDPSLARSDFLYLLNLVKPKLIFAGEECVDTIESCVKELNLKSVIIVHGETKKHIPFSNFLVSTGKEHVFEATPAKSVNDTPIIYFSSGTTGFPKGICSSHRSLQYNQEAFMQGSDPSVIMFFSTFYWISASILLIINLCSSHRSLQYNQEVFMQGRDLSVILFFSTFYWISASMFLIMNILSGTARVVVKRFDENTFMQIVEKYQVSLTFMPPINSYKLTKMYKSCDLNTSNFHTLIFTGVKVNEDQVIATKQLFPHTMVYSVYGMTEINGCMTFFDEKRDKQFINTKLESSGRPTSGFTYKFVDVETGKPVGINQCGELRLKGNYMMTGYYNNPEATKAAYDEDGFFCTGDIAYYDEDYFFYIVDRNKDLIKYQCWHIIPAELESVLMSHPDIKEAVVVGKPNEVDGEHPTACLILKENATVTKEDIIKYYNDNVEGFDRKKLRGGLYLVDKIPVTLSGKPIRRKLREQILNKTAIKL